MEKKKFVKPQMEAIKLNTKVSILAGSGLCYLDSSGGPGYCPENTATSRLLEEFDELM